MLISLKECNAAGKGCLQAVITHSQDQTGASSVDSLTENRQLNQARAAFGHAMSTKGTAFHFKLLLQEDGIVPDWLNVVEEYRADLS